MSEPIVITQRDDTAILEDIGHLIATYPPLANDRHAINVAVNNGAVTVSGHVMTTNTRRFFLSRITSVEGVKSVDAENLHDDNAIRIQLSPLISAGVQANVRHGVVILSGEPPQNIEELANKILALRGVEKVVSGFGG
jgi:osmotically-inducible protein OsmY